MFAILATGTISWINYAKLFQTTLDMFITCTSNFIKGRGGTSKTSYIFSNITSLTLAMVLNFSVKTSLECDTVWLHLSGWYFLNKILNLKTISLLAEFLFTPSTFLVLFKIILLLKLWGGMKKGGVRGEFLFFKEDKVFLAVNN